MNNNTVLLDLDDEHDWLNRLRKFSARDLLKEWIEKAKVAYHDHDGFQEHPVAVKHHKEYFSGKQTVISDIAPQTAQAQEEGVYKYLKHNEEFQQAMNSPTLTSKPRDRNDDDIHGYFLAQAKIAGEDPHTAGDKVHVANTILSGWSAAYQDDFVALRSALQTLTGKNMKQREYDFWLKSQHQDTAYEQRQFEKAWAHGQNNANLFAPYIAKTQKTLKEKYPDGYIYIYRGVRGKLGRDLIEAMKKGETNFVIPSDGISSFSIDEGVAHSFLYGSEGVVLKKKVPISAILLSFNAIMTYFSGEEEVLADSAYTSNFSRDEIEIFESRHEKDKK